MGVPQQLDVFFGNILAINEYHKLLLAQLSIRAPQGYAAPSFQQIIQADKFFWFKLAEKAGIDIGPTHIDPLVKEIRTYPEFFILFHFLPRPELQQPAQKPSASGPMATPKGGPERSRDNRDRDSPYKGKGGKGKSKGKFKIPTP